MPIQAYDRIDIRDHPGRDPGDAVRRHLPLLPRTVQGTGTRRAGARLAVRARSARLRSLSALPLQAIPFARLALLADLFGLDISEGALANLLQDSAAAFTAQASHIRRRLLSGAILQSMKPPCG